MYTKKGKEGKWQKNGGKQFNNFQVKKFSFLPTGEGNFDGDK